MTTNSKIEWTECTWNNVTGCSKKSKGCRRCYAETMSRRLKGMGQKKYQNGFQPTIHPECLMEPLLWKKSRMVFVNSMSDTFQEAVSDDFIRSIFQTMEQADWHTFQVLTKQAERLHQIAPDLPWPKNIWMGVTIESGDYLFRADYLRSVPAVLRFLSLEPLLGPIPNLDLSGIGWVIVGGESGPGALPVSEDWVVDILDQCLLAGVPFFFKQWGGRNKKQSGRTLLGRTWDETPTIQQSLQKQFSKVEEKDNG